ncbi:Hypothetical protein, putative [Bodo saltans]|uniref:Trichohyalin-plectin-homology domain-containing protein n=1 Tax=Bodo saltans TaxID=75058 RepID=A0A0S4J3I4_BODSA|nr:Hypothetical protein, putative [Bodo saltans]|eukprot:CUG69023.1 Hypothetical protein, putative [Bodo saltans]
MVVTQSTTLSSKLKDRVCAYANTNAHSLSPEASAWLARRIEEWVVQRSASDVDLRRAADDMIRRFPATQRATQQQSHHHHHHHGSTWNEGQPPQSSNTGVNQHLAQKVAHDNVRNAKRGGTGSSTGASTPNVLASSQSKHARDDGNIGGGASSVPLVDRNAAGSPIMSLRPQVLRRMQRLNDDAQFLAAFEKERDQIEVEQRKQLEDKNRRQAAVRHDMEVAERKRLAQIEIEKSEREKQRLVINAAIEEARLSEMDQKMLRKRNIQRERKSIQEQSRVNEQIREDAKRREEEDNQRLKDYNWQQERNKLLQEMEKATRSKSAMMIALEEGKASALEREEDRRAHRQESSPVFSTRVENRKDPNIVKRDQRELLQNAACRHYDSLQEGKRHALEKLDHSSMEAHIKQLRQQEEREEKDRERSIRLRAALVSSLDEELSAQRDRRKREDAEKLELRRIADAQMDEVEQQRRNAIRKEKREQERRREQMDAQLAARLERMTQPMNVKI